MNQETDSIAPQADIETTLGLTEQVGRRRGRRRWAVAAFIVIVALALIAIVWLRGDNAIGQIATQPVTRGDLTLTVTATGKLEPVNQVDVGSELSGTIESVAVDFNDQVKKGQVLARLDTEQLEARVVQARASLKAAEAQLLEAEATAVETAARLKRQRSLLAQNLTSQEQLDTARAARSRAQAAVQSAEAQVKLAEAALEADLTNLKKAVIVSPIDGIVLSRQIEPGQTVAASFQTPVLFQLAEDLKQMELHVDVDEADVGKVQAGQQALFTVDAYPDKRFTAEITQVHFAPKITQDVVTYESRLRVDNSQLLLRPGMTATADIVVGAFEQVLLVPNAALRFTPPAESSEGREATGWLAALLPGATTGVRVDGPAPPTAAAQQLVWHLHDNKLSPVVFQAGPTDGRHTLVTDGDLTSGMPLVTDLTTSQDERP